MIILVAKILHSIASERNDRILNLFQVLIVHRPGNSPHRSTMFLHFILSALIDLRISFAKYIQLFDSSFGQSLLPDPK